MDCIWYDDDCGASDGIRASYGSACTVGRDPHRLLILIERSVFDRYSFVATERMLEANAITNEITLAA